MSAAIRTAKVEDAPLIAAGEYETALTRGLLNAMPGEIPEGAFREKIRSIGESGGVYLVAESRGELVGHVLLDPMPLARNSHVCTLTIVVYRGWRGKGIGKQLLTRAIELARASPKIEKIELMVRDGNEPALRLYRSMGFEQEGRIRRRLKEADGAYLDDIAMALFVGART